MKPSSTHLQFYACQYFSILENLFSVFLFFEKTSLEIGSAPKQHAVLPVTGREGRSEWEQATHASEPAACGDITFCGSVHGSGRVIRGSRWPVGLSGGVGRAAQRGAAERV